MMPNFEDVRVVSPRRRWRRAVCAMMMLALATIGIVVATTQSGGADATPVEDDELVGDMGSGK